MFYKYLKFILVSTVFLQASPEVFSSLGDELEAFQEDCKGFEKLSFIPEKIKKRCHTFYPQVSKVFEFGYKLNPYVESDTIINDKELNRYLSRLRHLDKKKENILFLVYSEVNKARKEKNFTYYSQLISNDNIKLYSIDYEFMGKNEKIFSKNKRYISQLEYIEYLRAERLKKENAKRIKYITYRGEIMSELPIQLNKNDLVSTSLLEQKSPKVFSSLGDELEAFQEDCKGFEKLSFIPEKIKKRCHAFYPQVSKVFEFGYKLDPYVENDAIINEKELTRYLSLLRKLDKNKEKILHLMHAEVSKARKQKNFTYYSQLIANYQIKLYSVDYAFMEKNKKIFSKNKRYISHIKYLRAERLRKEKAKRVHYKKGRK
ncbi:MAG: hypothetical protein KC427_07155 [Sulfurovum sp.]|uniref:hypothetical protein n=1 Tax=Sulfurovum sp. TaxID=1969726 RepID=UPI002867DA2C|nr:hypothetical protein [Sulfurovum sp.]MCO4845781.1 hypothetical protein [Sulfurovum sp.]